jgi:hypothetical protein
VFPKGSNRKGLSQLCFILKLYKYFCIPTYQTWANPVNKGFEEAARFLRGQKIFDADDIACPIQLVALSAILTIIGDRSCSL